MKKGLALVLTVAVGVAAIVLLNKFFNLGEALSTLWQAPLWTVPAYILITICILGTLVWRWQLIIKVLHKKAPSYGQLFWYHLIGYAVSYITPGAKIGGEAFRAGMLRRHGLSFKKAGSTVFIDKTIELTTSATFFIIGISILLFIHAVPHEATTLLIVMASLLLVLMIAFYYQMFSGNDFIGKLFKLTRLHKTKKGSVLEKQIAEFEEHILSFYKKDKKHFIQAVVLSMVSWGLMFVEFSIVFAMLGFTQPTILQLFLVITFIGLAYIIPIPMALGTLEAGQVGAFSLIGFAQAAGLGVALITRLKDIIISIIGFMAMGFYGMHLGKDIKEVIPFRENIKELRAKK